MTDFDRVIFQDTLHLIRLYIEKLDEIEPLCEAPPILEADGDSQDYDVDPWCEANYGRVMFMDVSYQQLHTAF